MPTYEYRCPDCGHRFERFQRMTEAPGASCPACGAAAERLLSAGAGFLFRGEGFYITDYRSDDYRKRAAAENGSPAGAQPGVGSSGQGSGAEPAAGTGSGSPPSTAGRAADAGGAPSSVSEPAPSPSRGGRSPGSGAASPPPAASEGG